MREISCRLLVIGAGPTGLGAAKRLQQLVCPPSPSSNSSDRWAQRWANVDSPTERTQLADCRLG